MSQQKYCMKPLILIISSIICAFLLLLIIFLFQSQHEVYMWHKILPALIPAWYNSTNLLNQLHHHNTVTNIQPKQNGSIHTISPTVIRVWETNKSSYYMNYSNSSIAHELRSLRRLEEGLRSARVALQAINKKAQDFNKKINDSSSRTLHEEEQKLMNTHYSHGHDDDDDESHHFYPQGPIYKNAPLFHESYTQMEKRFKIFVYREGKQPLVHDGPCKDIYSTEGRFIHALKESNPFVTTDPYKAHMFFFPFSVSKMVSYLYKPGSLDMSPLIHFVKDYVEVIGGKYPFWNRSEGADHFMLSCHDWGPHVSRAHPHLERHAIRVLCNANSSEGFIPHKDASLPEINMVGGYIPKHLGGFPMKERTYLAFFAGQEHGPVRPTLFKHWGGKDSDMKVFHKLTHAKVNESYEAFMKKTRFCLCPGGFEVNSPRIVEAIYYDCIPVIIADGFVLPFSDVLDWDAFSIQVKEKDIPRLKEILLDVPMAKCEELQGRIREVKRHFFLNKPPLRYDLFHMILHSVWLRRLNIRLNYELYR